MFLTTAVVAATGAVGGAVLLAIGTYLEDDAIQEPELRVDGELVASATRVIDGRNEA